MTDLTKLTISEVKNLVEGTEDGYEVRIYANDGGGGFPIHGAIKCGHWCMERWSKDGKLPARFKNSGANLKLNTPSEEYS